MAAASRAPQHSEAPVKGYELEAVKKDVANHDKFISSFDTKLDTIITLLNSRPTTEQVDDKIKLAIKDAVEKLDLRYGPIVANNKRLLWAVVSTTLGLFASLILLVAGVLTR